MFFLVIRKARKAWSRNSQISKKNIQIQCFFFVCMLCRIVLKEYFRRRVSTKKENSMFWTPVLLDDIFQVFQGLTKRSEDFRESID